MISYATSHPHLPGSISLEAPPLAVPGAAPRDNAGYSSRILGLDRIAVFFSARGAMLNTGASLGAADRASSGNCSNMRGLAASARFFFTAASAAPSVVSLQQASVRGAAVRVSQGKASFARGLAAMARLLREAMQAGALGFATSRLSIHKTADGGSIPTFDADIQELREICGGMADAGTGTLQIVLDAFAGWDREYPIIDELMASSGRPATFTLASGNEGPPRWRNVLELMAQSKAKGAHVTAQIMPRPIGLIGGLELSVHPFIMCPSWQKIAHLPLDQKVAAMRDPDAEEPEEADAAYAYLVSAVRRLMRTSGARSRRSSSPTARW